MSSRKTPNSNAGFTLIELVLVIGIACVGAATLPPVVRYFHGSESASPTAIESASEESALVATSQPAKQPVAVPSEAPDSQKAPAPTPATAAVPAMKEKADSADSVDTLIGRFIRNFDSLQAAETETLLLEKTGLLNTLLKLAKTAAGSAEFTHAYSRAHEQAPTAAEDLASALVRADPTLESLFSESPLTP